MEKVSLESGGHLKAAELTTRNTNGIQLFIAVSVLEWQSFLVALRKFSLQSRSQKNTPTEALF